MLFYLYVFLCSACTRAQAFIFHNQAEGEALEGTWVSLAKLTFSMEVEQLQRWSSTEFLALFAQEFGAFHRLRLEKRVIRATSVQGNLSFSIATMTQYDLAHDVTKMNPF